MKFFFFSLFLSLGMTPLLSLEANESSLGFFKKRKQKKVENFKALLRQYKDIYQNGADQTEVQLSSKDLGSREKKLLRLQKEYQQRNANLAGSFLKNPSSRDQRKFEKETKNLLNTYLKEKEKASKNPLSKEEEREDLKNTFEQHKQANLDSLKELEARLISYQKQREPSSSQQNEDLMKKINGAKKEIENRKAHMELADKLIREQGTIEDLEKGRMAIGQNYNNEIYDSSAKTVIQVTVPPQVAKKPNLPTRLKTFIRR